MKPNNIHIAYLRRIEETMSIRAKRRKLFNIMAKSGCNALDIERMRNKHRACRLWEQSHAVVL